MTVVASKKRDLGLVRGFICRGFHSKAGAGLPAAQPGGLRFARPVRGCAVGQCGVGVQAYLPARQPQPVQQGILAARKLRKPGHDHRAVIARHKKLRYCGIRLCNGKGVKGRGCPATIYKFRHICLAYAPQSAQQGSGRAGNLLLHMGKIHSRHALAQHFFQQV